MVYGRQSQICAKTFRVNSYLSGYFGRKSPGMARRGNFRDQSTYNNVLRNGGRMAREYKKEEKIMMSQNLTGNKRNIGQGCHDYHP